MLGADGQAGPSGLTRVTLGPERLRVVAGPDWSGERAVGALSDLSKAGWILQAPPSPMRRAIEAGIPIYYQPAAVVHHRVPASRLTRRFLLERCYLEGISLLDVEEKRGILTSERLERHMRWHHIHLMRKVASLLGRPSFAPWNDPGVLETLSKIALSISIIRRGHLLMPHLPAPRP